MVFEALVSYIAQNFDIDKEDITRETTFEQFRAESENIVDLYFEMSRRFEKYKSTMYFEMSRRFDIIADEDDLYGMETVGELEALIKELIAETEG